MLTLTFTDISIPDFIRIFFKNSIFMIKTQSQDVDPAQPGTLHHSAPAVR